MQYITSKDNPLIKSAIKLQSKKYRDINSKFLAEGKRIISDIKNYDSSLIDNIIVSESAPDKSMGDIHVSDKIFALLSETENSQGVIAIINKPKVNPIGDSILFLDRVRDPGNIGTLIRCGVATGFNDILLLETVDAYNSKVVRSTMSTIVKANIQSANIEVLARLKTSGYKIVIADMDGINAYEFKNTYDKICLVIGNEANGVSAEIKEIADITLTLPMLNDVESLNAAVSGSVLMYNLKNLK